MVKIKEVTRYSLIRLLKKKYSTVKEHSFIIRYWDMEKGEIIAIFDSKDYDEMKNMFIDVEKESEKHNLYEENLEVEFFIEDSARYCLKASTKE